MAEAQSTTRRIFTFAEAVALLPDLRGITEEAHAQVEALRARGQKRGLTPQLRREADAVVQAWAATVKDLGVEVKGLWLVDFDNGSGYYCWRYPEERLEYYHSYEDGFGGRIRIH